MSFFQQSILTTLSSKFDESQWVKQLQKTLDEEEQEDEYQIPVTIFGVPKALVMTAGPDSYSPQQVAIGPYHHLRLELYDMERYKVAAAKRIQRELNNVKLQNLVDHLMQHELRIRACYHRPVSFGCEALAWMMAVDVCFMYEFIRIKQRKIPGQIPTGLSHLIDASGNKAAHNSILRDIIMLENQIPMFVMRMLLELQFRSADIADQNLRDMLAGISREMSPFETSNTVEVKDRAHLLDFLYHFIVPKHEVSFLSHQNKREGGSLAVETTKDNNPSQSKQVMIWMKRVLSSKVVLKFPWTIMSKIPIVQMFKKPVMRALSKGKEKKDYEELGSKPPLLEEIRIPSVSELAEVGIEFVVSEAGISSINFDEKTLIFDFPIIRLDVNSEVVLRNLVAYEACFTSGPLILARYTELMNAIIEDEDDARFLCERGIVVNHLKSEREVADMWNGMSKSVRLTKVPSLDRVIADVNRYYNSRWKVKTGKFMREYVFGSWKFLTFVAAIVTLLLMVLQAFCQVYSCSRIFPIKALESND